MMCMFICVRRFGCRAEKGLVFTCGVGGGEWGKWLRAEEPH